MTNEYVLDIVAHSANLKIEPTGSKDTGIFFPQNLIEFLGDEKLSYTFRIYKDECIEALLNILNALPLYSNKSGKRVVHENRAYECENLIKEIFKYFKDNNSVSYSGTISTTTGGRKYLYSLEDKTTGFSIRKFLVADKSQIKFIKRDSCVELHIKTFDGFISNQINDNSDNKIGNDEIIFPHQTIYYGVPGCGKSYTVKEKLKEDKIDSENVVRVVFHPDYSNADFVGQIYPSITGEYKTVYKFKAGPFSKILKMAYLNPTKSYCLVIEEINRGNAAAIFGDLFQLLDRIEKEDDSVKEGEGEGCGNHYELGWSCYGVDNEAINGYIRSLENKMNLPDNVKSREFKNDVPEICFESLDIYCDSADNQNGVKPLVHFNANTAIRLPPNLSILATMNTSDQNVFTLDNAFQRRWKMEYIPNELNDSKQYDLEIGETKVKWGDFHKAINELIKEKSQSFGGYASAEDKCLGGYFITAKNENSNPSKETKDSEATTNNAKKEAYIDGKEFAEKVLKFLWDDAFKMSREGVFKTEVKSFSDLLTAFNEGNSEKAFENVFVSEFADKLNLTLRHSPHDP